MNADRELPQRPFPKGESHNKFVLGVQTSRAGSVEMVWRFPRSSLPNARPRLTTMRKQGANPRLLRATPPAVLLTADLRAERA
jgi:hypothetical protein